MDRRCFNCAEIDKHRCKGEGECGLRLPIAYQMAEPHKIGNFAAVMQALNLRVEIIGDGFSIVAA